jgi:regulator of replication initiation timing
MGLFDRWRRKKKPMTTIQHKKTKSIKLEQVMTPETDVDVSSEDVSVLVAEYEKLVQRREQLQVERRELTATLERGEMDHDDFRKEMMNRIQEASAVSEKLLVTGSKLTSLGYRGIRS